MKKVRTEDAVGNVLAHDMTRILPGKFKGVGFKKGHRVRAEDLDALRKMGKRHLYVLELSDDTLHEDDAALRIAGAVAGENLTYTEPSEGKSAIVTSVDGLLSIETGALMEINKIGRIVVSTLKNHFPVEKGQTVAATRIIPLVIEKERIESLERLAGGAGPVVKVLPFRKLKVGAVVTGSEIYEGLVKDEFDAFVGKKVVDYGCTIHKKILVPDDVEMISAAVTELSEMGCELILTTGGLSVDPDDVTRAGVSAAGANLRFYGSPILPGAMFLYADLGGIPIMGLPACVFYHRATVFDLILPRILAGVKVTEDDIAAMGHGGLCMNCDTCHFPRCTFGN